MPGPFHTEKVRAVLSDAKAARSDVLVLGGGIIGLSTGLVLQSLGLRVTILMEHSPRQLPGEPQRPLIATGYAMASAYPHNLRVRDLLGVSDASQAVLRQLHADYAKGNLKSGIYLYHMFEVFEQEPSAAPPLASRRRNFLAFDGYPQTIKESINPPVRPGANYIWGWSFDTYFADMPIYMQYLWSLFGERGGIAFLTDQFTVRDVTDACGSSRAVFNCLGLGAIAASNDFAPAVIMRGHQVLVENAPMLLTADDGLPICYNYSPTADIFPRADGTPEYVHFFPRSDGWVLGQTREPGQLDADDNWTGEEVLSPFIEIGGAKVPEPIVTLNETLLFEWKNAPLARNKMVARAGYRYYRDPDGIGVRLESEKVDETLVVHNYGHGGSGITMSWGCAIQSAALLFAADGDLKPRAAAYGSAFDEVIAKQLTYFM